VRARRRGDVHQAGIVRDRRARQGQNIDGLLQARLPAQVEYALSAGRTNAFAHLVLTLRPEHDDDRAVSSQRGREFAEVLEWPAFGRTICGAWHQRDEILRLGAQLCSEACAIAGVRREFGIWRIRQFCIGRQAQRHESLDRLVESKLVQAAHVVEQTVAHLAAETGAPRNIGEKRHECGLQGSRHDDRVRVALGAQGTADAIPFTDLQLTMADG